MTASGAAQQTGQTGAMLRQDRRGDVALITLCHAPDPALSAPLCAALIAALAAAEADPDVTAIVLTSDLTDFAAVEFPAAADAHAVVAAQRALCHRVEGLTKPVVVALQGQVLGAGLELALAAHGRVASESAALGLPAVTLGLVPAAGGSRRQPRLVGAERALRLLLSGRPASAVEALGIGLLDRVVEADPLPAALELAQKLAAGPLRRTIDRRDGMRDALAYQQAVAAARAALVPGPVLAAARIIDCVEAALLLPAEQALEFEAAQYSDLSTTAEAAGLRHAALAEWRARPPATALSEEDGPARLAIWGAAQSAEVAFAALRAGMRVHLADPSREVLVKALERIAVMQEQALRQGTLSQSGLDEEWARLQPQLDPARLTDCDIVLLTATAAPPAPAAAAVLSLVTGGPEAAMRLTLSGQMSGGAGDLVEIALTGPTAPARSAQALAFAHRLGWRAVLTRPEPGDETPVAVRLARAIAECVAHLERAGHPRPDIARALAAHGIAGEGTTHRPSRDEAAIARRCIAALANAGARLIESGVLRSPSEVDLVAIGAGLMARHSGGPMYQADQRGMLILLRDLRQWAEENPALWQPAPLIDRLWSDGARFARLDAAPPAGQDAPAQARKIQRRWRRA